MKVSIWKLVKIDPLTIRKYPHWKNSSNNRLEYIGTYNLFFENFTEQKIARWLFESCGFGIFTI